MFAKKIFEFSELFPDLGIKSKGAGKYCKKLKLDEGKYLSFAFFISLIFGTVGTITAIFFAILELEIVMAGALFLIMFGTTFFFFLKLPENVELALEAEMEAEMPLVLRTIGMLLDLKVPFIQALKSAATEGELGVEFAKIVNEVEEGVGLSKALAKFAEETENATIKKSAAQLISVYEHGAHGSEIIQIADDLLSLQRYHMRDFVSKSAFFGLLFVIFAVVVPTFFLVFATAGKFILDVEISTITFLLIFLILFPFIDAMILFVSISQMPPNIFGRREKNQNILIFAGLVIVLAAIMLLDIEIVGKFIAVISITFAAWFVFEKDYREERKIEKIEDGLPNALLGVSGLPKNYGIEKILEKMAAKKDEIGSETEKTLRQLKAHIGIEKALTDMWKRNHSFMLRRMGDLMLCAHLAGANVSEKMHEMAEDLLRFAELKRERENALSLQKYTLVLGALIVPLILASSLSLVKQITEFIGEKNEGVLNAAPNAISAYIILYSALSAFYIANSESRVSRSVLYFACMAFIGLVGFYILSQIK